MKSTETSAFYIQATKKAIPKNVADLKPMKSDNFVVKCLRKSDVADF